MRSATRTRRSSAAIDRAGREGDPRLQPVPRARAGEARRPAVRAKLRGLCVLRQFRRRGDGRRDQDRAQVPRRQRAARALSHHHVRRRVPRPHARDARGRRTEEISRRLRARGRGLRPGAVRRPRGGEEGDRAADRRDPDRADPGRRRRARAGEPVPPQPARALRPARPAADLRRGAVRHGPQRRAVRVPAHRRRARHHGARQGARRRLSGRRVPHHQGSRQGHDARHARLDLRRQSARAWRRAMRCST